MFAACRRCLLTSYLSASLRLPRTPRSTVSDIRGDRWLCVLPRRRNNVNVNESRARVREDDLRNGASGQRATRLARKKQKLAVFSREVDLPSRRRGTLIAVAFWGTLPCRARGVPWHPSCCSSAQSLCAARRASNRGMTTTTPCTVAASRDLAFVRPPSSAWIQRPPTTEAPLR